MSVHISVSARIEASEVRPCVHVTSVVSNGGRLVLKAMVLNLPLLVFRYEQLNLRDLSFGRAALHAPPTSLGPK